MDSISPRMTTPLDRSCSHKLLALLLELSAHLDIEIKISVLEFNSLTLSFQINKVVYIEQEENKSS